MKRNLRITIISLTLTLTVFSAVFAITVSAKEQKSSLTSTPEAEVYIIKSYNNKPAIFKNDSPLPIMELDVFTHQLPQKDIDRLNSGIVVNSLEEAIRFAEDYE
jgi:hypothetical protein